MSKFTYELVVTENSQKEADSKMKSITVLASKLSTKALNKMEDMLKNDPQKTAMALKILGA